VGGGAFPKARVRDSDTALYARPLIFRMLTTRRQALYYTYHVNVLWNKHNKLDVVIKNMLLKIEWIMNKIISSFSLTFYFLIRQSYLQMKRHCGAHSLCEKIEGTHTM
jgi:hypothetical protein